MSTHTFSNGDDTNLRKLNNTNWSTADGNATMLAVYGTIGSSTSIEATPQSVAITNGEGSVSFTATATYIVIKFGDGSLAFIKAPT